MEKITKNISLGIVGISFLISSPLITGYVLKTTAVEEKKPVKTAFVAEETSEPTETTEITETKATQPAAEFSSEQEKSTEPVETVPLEPGSKFVKSDKSYFDDALFIGDSRMVDIRDYGTFEKSSFLCAVGLSTYKVTGDRIVDGDTLSRKCNERDFGKVYIMLGLNEVADSPESFRDGMVQLMEEVRQYEPEALIFLMANLHVTSAYSANNPSESNERINMFNEVLEELCDDEKVFYLDVNPLFDDEDGSLPEDLTGDGVHPYATCYPDWCDWLCEHTVTEQSQLAAAPGMNFGQAIESLKNNQFVSRKAWNDENIFLKLDSSSEETRIQKQTADGKIVTWVASQEDMLATDWFILE